ncbi:lysoplasmalogenase family protein [Hydrogenophaga taeniospiralis]|uniref:lysoplasmalogenase family protein n=1 Tax=Hydrogenophaga taeniospiralis TaxID=65656 RepID=UPI001CFAE0C9|nr:lysoplasmalogenase family protein [Hydrogenophaga taeniospiralis]UCU93606.1 sterol desaturase family protein [Hydrogenophaga taeniospiralis]
MSPSQIIVLATPVFFALIAIEFVVGLRRGRNTYRFDDALNSISLGMLSQASVVLVPLLKIGIYTAAFNSLSLVPDTGFWTTLPGWLLALLFYDFLYYWNHRLGHTVGIFWAAHVVHHQSQDYNLSTALRQPSSYPLLGWVFYLPMALAGVPPLVFAVVALIDLLYQFWIHTGQIGSLGRFDRWFASPSNHRVHHAVNDRYVDKNYGGILMLWDHLFGSFEPEDPREPCVYGTRSPLNSWDPLWANAEVYTALARDSWHTRHWADKLRVWLKPPGWRPADVAAAFPKQPFDITTVKTYAPPVTRPVRVFAAWQFVALLGGVAAFLWRADTAALSHNLAWFTALFAGLWAVGALLQGRISRGEVLLIECAALSMASAATGWTAVHLVFKPLTMVVALAVVIAAMRSRADSTLTGPRGASLLLAALAASLAGDVFLMLDGLFIPGLAAFLLAHLAYIALFRQGVPWLANRPAAWGVAAVGLGMYTVLWFGGLPPGLRGPVAAYVLAIGLMAAQALGRASVQRDGPSMVVAVGAACFMLSDALLAINRFVSPLPMSAFWVLGSYYAAQCLMVMGVLRGAAIALKANRYPPIRAPERHPDA